MGIQARNYLVNEQPLTAWPVKSCRSRCPRPAFASNNSRFCGFLTLCPGNPGPPGPPGKPVCPSKFGWPLGPGEPCGPVRPGNPSWPLRPKINLNIMIYIYY
uniref:Candidate secreted effector n=1 Tax=Meloidogyne incognita TaxID=6306 RepID=A0A914MPZ4_MELIC